MNQESSPPEPQYSLPPTAIVGIVAGAFGRRGEVRVESHTDNPKRLSRGSRLLALGQTLQIDHCRWHQGFALIKFRGIDTPEDAKRLLGVHLEVTLDEVPPLTPNSYYHFQILDMEVWTQTGEFLGTVVEILKTASNDVYVVRHDKKEILIPAIQDVIINIDVDGGRITVDLLEGLQ